MAEELPARVFDARDGMPRNSVIFRVRALERDNSLWLGADRGAYRFDGRRWVRYRLPDSLQSQNVRDFLVTADGSLWMALRDGILRDLRGVQSWHPVPAGVTRAPVWKLAVTDVLGAPETLVASLGVGAVRWTGSQFEPLPLPPSIPHTNLVTASTRRGGQSSLWFGSLEGGLVRLHRGRWQRFGEAEGLPSDARIEHLQTTSSDDRGELLVTAIDGTYLFVDGRFERLRQGGGFHIRSVRFTSEGVEETWTALTNGDLLRNRGDGIWRNVRPMGRQPSGSPQSLGVATETDGSALVYVGYRGGMLARYRIGRASAVHMPQLAAGRAVRTLYPDGDRLYMGTRGGGFYQLSTAPGGSASRRISDTVDVIDLVRASPALGGELFALTYTQGVWRQTADDRWALDTPLGQGTVSWQIEEGLGADGRPALLVANREGQLLQRTPSGWTSWPGLPMKRAVVSLVTDMQRARPAMWAATDNAIWRWDGRTWTELLRNVVPAGTTVLGLRRQTLPSGKQRVWVYSDAGAIDWFDPDVPDAAVRLHRLPLAESLRPSIHAVYDLFVRADGNLLAATDDGLLNLTVAPSGDTAVVSASFAEEDGLPQTDVLAIAPTSQPGELWVGTAGGLGRVRIGTSVPEPGMSALTGALFRLDAMDVEVDSGVAIPWTSRDLRMDFRLRTDYREEQTRYRYQLDDEQRSARAWTEEQSASLRGLPAGQHRIRIWAADAHGHEIGPLVRDFRILPPFWRSPPMLVLYTGGGAALVWMVTSWRTRALRRRQRELEQNERRLAESERRFRLLFEESPDAQLLIKLGVVLAANPAAGALLSEDGDGRHLKGLAIAPLIPALAAPLPATAGGIETEARTLGGTVLPVQLRHTTFSSEGAALQHVELRDLRALRALAAERANLERQLRESQRLEALGTLAGGVAHDFNNLLTVIRNGAEMARDSEQRGEFDPESIEAILSASARARDLVRQILTFSRRLPTRTDRVVMHDLLDELQPMFRATLPSTIRLVVDEQAPKAVVQGDRTQLTQVLLNLCTNAEHAMRSREQGVLTVQTSMIELPSGARDVHRPLPDGSYVRITVSDTGHGMADDVRARIFEPFFTTKPVGEGTGLGLAVLHGIVTSHGGSVAVDSVSQQGTTFEILLPVVARLSTPALGTPAYALGSAATRARILLVDDEALVLSASERILTRFGFEVHACNRGADAIAVLESDQQVDVVVTDLTMPDVTGETIARAAMRSRPGLPVILITGFGGDVSAAAREAGVLEIVQKPYELHELVSAISRALGLTTSTRG